MIDSSDSSATLFPHRSCSLHFAVSGSESLPLVTFILKRYWHNAQTGALNLFPSNLMPLLNRGGGDIPLAFQRLLDKHSVPTCVCPGSHYVWSRDVCTLYTLKEWRATVVPLSRALMSKLDKKATTQHRTGCVSGRQILPQRLALRSGGIHLRNSRSVDRRTMAAGTWILFPRQRFEGMARTPVPWQVVF